MNKALNDLQDAVSSKITEEVKEATKELTNAEARLGSLKSLAMGMMERNQKDKENYIKQSLMLVGATLMHTSSPEEFLKYSIDLILILPNKEDQAVVREVSSVVFKGMIIHASGTDIFSGVLTEITNSMKNTTKDENLNANIIKSIKDIKKGRP